MVTDPFLSLTINAYWPIVIYKYALLCVPLRSNILPYLSNKDECEECNPLVPSGRALTTRTSCFSRLVILLSPFSLILDF
jgi:hypothetical protein